MREVGFYGCPYEEKQPFILMIKRDQKEKNLVVKPVLKKLKFYKELTGNIIWYQRLVAEDDIHCPAGTPDIVAVVNCETYIVLLFIECKRPGVNNLSYTQKKFFESMKGKIKTMCVMLNDPKKLSDVIKKAKEMK